MLFRSRRRNTAITMVMVNMASIMAMVNGMVMAMAMAMENISQVKSKYLIF